MKKALVKVLAAAALVGVAQTAMAAAPGTGDEFSEFYTKVADWTGGALGMGLATTMLLIGGAMGVAKNSPMPALSGIAGAAFFHWGPEIIVQIMSGGTMI